MKKNLIIILAIILAALVVGVYFYPRLPEHVASHWNAQGEVDGYLPKLWGTFLMPLMMAVMALLFIAIPKIDPLKANVEKFKKYYHGFILVLMVFFFLMHLQVILWAVGLKINPAKTMPAAMGVLFFFAGILCEKSERNWFIGIRTPWTLASENVWKKTHRLGGKLFKISGLLAVLGVFFGEWAFYFVLIPAIFSAVYATIFSYFEYRKETTER